MRLRFSRFAAGRLWTAAFLVSAGMLPAWAQTAASTPVIPTSGPYRVAGTVVNAATGEPVRGAMVALLTAEDSRTFASTESGDDGHFALEHLPPAKFQLTASKRGYSTSFYDEHEEYSSAIVTGEGQETGNLTFKLTSGAVLSGVISGDGGDPVAGAMVMLFEKPHGRGPGSKVEQAGAATTDDTGAYEFPDLTAGEYMLAVRAHPWYAMNHFATGLHQGQETEQQAALDVAYPVTFFDSTTDEGSAASIELTGGSRQQANISLHAVPALHLEVDAPRRPDGSSALPELRRTLFGIDVAGGFFMTSRSTDGVTELGGLAPGQYELTQGDPPRVMELNATGSQHVDPDAGAPAVSVGGMLLGGALNGSMAVTLEPADRAASQRSLQTLASQHDFQFPAVPAGTWKLELESSEVRVASITVGGRTQAGNRVTVQDRPLSLGVSVVGSTARIEGFARKGGKGLAGAMVVLVPRHSSEIAELARRDQSDSDGSFALRNVAPGEYTVVAIENGWGLDWANPQVIGRYLPGGVAVTVKGETSDEPGKRISLSEPVTVQLRQ